MTDTQLKQIITAIILTTYNWKGSSEDLDFAQIIANKIIKEVKS